MTWIRNRCIQNVLDVAQRLKIEVNVENKFLHSIYDTKMPIKT